MFRSSFDDFSGPGTTSTGKVENRPQMTRFTARNILTLFCGVVLSFPISTAKQCFRPILNTFLGPGTTRACLGKAKMITGLGWPGFAPETYPQCLGCSSNRLSWMLLKTVLVEFWPLFRAQAPLEQVKLKTGPGWLSLHPKHTHIICGDIHNVFSQYSWKMFRPNVEDFSRPGYHSSW